MALLKWLYPGMRVKRWFFLFTGGVVAAGFSLALLLNYKFKAYFCSGNQVTLKKSI